MCILRDQMSCLRYCFALCEINLFSVKPLWGFILVSSRDDVLAVIVFRKTIRFWLYRIIVGRNVQESELCRLSFLYRELRRFSSNALQRLWLNLVKLQFFINQKCSTVKGDSADWACAMPRNQSVCRVGLPLWDETLIELCRLKGDSGVLETV
jgi:hypothetical protein